MQKVENIEYKSISRKAISCMRLNEVLVDLAVLAVVLVALIILLANEIVSPAVFAIIAIVLLVLMIAFTIAAPIIRYKRYKYYIDDDMLVVIEGLFFVTKSIAPIERIHQIEIRRGPIDRLFGMSNVVVTTAGGEIRIAFLENDVAEEISSRLKTRINGIVKSTKEVQAEVL